MAEVEARTEALPVGWPAGAQAALLLAALWPHGVWMARRLVDGSDEPWGIVALTTVMVLVFHARRQFVPPSSQALTATGVLTLVATAGTLALPSLLAAALAMLALAVWLSAALPSRPAAPIATLLLLALPIIASLHFYLGYPLRLASAFAAAPLLTAFGVPVVPAGAALVLDGRTVLIDPPCAGIGMLWIGSYLAALLSYLNRASVRRTLVNALAAAVVVFAANVLRNATLFLPEAGLVSWPAWTHEAIGLAAFALAVPAIVAVAHRRSR